jgi:protein-S-isoprenylcysteine O-methyltransferase Ste14
MESSRRTLRTWTGVAVGFALLYSAIALVVLANTGQEVGQVSPPLGAIVAVIAVLFWFGVMFAASGMYGAARVVLVMGGILGFPLGMVMVAAGRKIRDSGNALTEDEVSVLS